MCQECVEKGFMTEEQNERMTAGEDPANVLSAEQISTIYSAGMASKPIVITSENLDEAPDFIRDLFKNKPAQDPREEAQGGIDNAVDALMEFVKGKRESLSQAGSADLIEDPRAMYKYLEMLAGEIMFKMDSPATIAFVLAAIADRHATLLDQAGPPKVKAAGSDSARSGMYL